MRAQMQYGFGFWNGLNLQSCQIGCSLLPQRKFRCFAEISSFHFAREPTVPLRLGPKNFREEAGKEFCQFHGEGELSLVWLPNRLEPYRCSCGFKTNQVEGGAGAVLPERVSEFEA